jgi:hypothetical protein
VFEIRFKNESSFINTKQVVMEQPIALERQVNNDKWESSEEHLRKNPKLTGVIVEYIPGEHIYKVVRDEEGNLIRLHYDRLCMKCNMLFLHETGLDKLFICQECLNKK